eukprot:Hpha_TRINITY_DN16075_c0_g2::TRINITY_DN16075_c0_g2_i10::g.116888::m.116888
MEYGSVSSGVVLYALVGAAESRVTLELEVHATMGDLKRAVHEAGGPPPEEQVVKFSGDTLTEDSATLADLGLCPESTVVVSRVTRLRSTPTQCVQRIDPNPWYCASLIVGIFPAPPVVWTFFSERERAGLLLGSGAVLYLATAAVDFAFLQADKEGREEDKRKMKGLGAFVFLLDGFGNCISAALAGFSYLLLRLSSSLSGVPPWGLGFLTPELCAAGCTGGAYLLMLAALLLPVGRCLNLGSILVDAALRGRCHFPRCPP